MADLERVAVRVSDGIRNTLSRVSSLALGLAAMTAIIGSRRSLRAVGLRRQYRLVGGRWGRVLRADGRRVARLVSARHDEVARLPGCCTVMSSPATPERVDQLRHGRTTGEHRQDLRSIAIRPAQAKQRTARPLRRGGNLQHPALAASPCSAPSRSALGTSSSSGSSAEVVDARWAAVMRRAAGTRAVLRPCCGTRDPPRRGSNRRRFRHQPGRTRRERPRTSCGWQSPCRGCH